MAPKPRCCVNPDCNDGKPQEKENFSNSQWDKGGKNGSKCMVCVKNNLGPPSGRTKKRKASNDLARAAKEHAEEVKDRLAEAEKTGDEATILALKRECEEADASAAVASEKSFNAQQRARYKKSNDAALAAQRNAEEAEEQLAGAEKTGDEATISALRKKKEEADASAAVATEKSFNGKRNDRNRKSNELARAAKKRAEEAEDQLAEAEKSGADDLKISALRKEKEEADADAEDKRLNSINGKQNDRRKEGNDLALAAKKHAEEVKDRLAEAEKSGADEAKISALKRELELANASAEELRQKSRNGQENDRNRKSNDLARAAKEHAEEVKDRLAEAEKTGDEATILALKRELELANASAEDARNNSYNGKQNDRRSKKTFPSGFVLDTRTLFDGVDTLRPNRKPSPRTDVSEFGQIISNGFKNGHSVKDVVAALDNLKTK